MSRCRSCNAEILWAKTENGKWIPIDPDPDPAGNVWWPHKNDEAVVLGQKLEVRGMDPEDRYFSHFKTCPDSDQHRRKP